MALVDPEDDVEGETGYLKVDIVVLGPEDTMPVHSIDEAKKPVYKYFILLFNFNIL